LAKWTTDGSDGFWKRSCFFCCWGRDELGEGNHAVSVGICLSVQFSCLFDGGPRSLGEFLNIKRSASILISGNEVLSSTDKLRFFLNIRFGVRGLSGFGFGDKFGTKGPRKGVLGCPSDLLFALNVHDRLRFNLLNNIRQRYTTGGWRRGCFHRWNGNGRFG
tara:strand:- start:97 stop:582 length:486 start_codon:yes stop_codon:yes gene_type:complete